MGYEFAYFVIYMATFRENLLAVTSQQILADVSSETLIRLTSKLHCVTFVINSQVLYFFLQDQTLWLFRNCYSKPRYGGPLPVIPLKEEAIGPLFIVSYLHKLICLPYCIFIDRLYMSSGTDCMLHSRRI